MAKVAKIEDPSEIRKWLVWIEPEEGEDWGELTSSIWSGRRFRPVTLCVVVTQNSHETWADWSQARGEDRGYSLAGTFEFENDEREWMPQWVRDAEFQAVEAVRKQVSP
jgi:hypothetical protein